MFDRDLADAHCILVAPIGDFEVDSGRLPGDGREDKRPALDEGVLVEFRRGRRGRLALGQDRKSHCTDRKRPLRSTSAVS